MRSILQTIGNRPAPAPDLPGGLEPCSDDNLRDKALRDKALRNSGFTIIELMIVLLILGLTLTYGVPAFQRTVKNNQLQTQLYALRSTLSNARSEAMAQRIPVSVCEGNAALSACATSTTAWDGGFLAFIDNDNDQIIDPNDTIVLAHRISLPSTFFMRFSDVGGTAQSNLSFSQRGDSLNDAGTFVLCDDRGAEEARALILRASGQVSVAIDTDDPEDGIVDDGNNDNVSCGP